MEPAVQPCSGPAPRQRLLRVCDAGRASARGLNGAYAQWFNGPTPPNAGALAIVRATWSR